MQNLHSLHNANAYYYVLSCNVCTKQKPTAALPKHAKSIFSHWKNYDRVTVFKIVLNKYEGVNISSTFICGHIKVMLTHHFSQPTDVVSLQ